MKKVALQTLGCRLNQYESDALAAKFVVNQYQIVNFNEIADVYIINSCTVTAKSDAKSRNFINRARKNPNALVVITGCYAEKDQLNLEQNPLTLVLKNDHKAQIFNIVDSFFRGENFSLEKVITNRFDFDSEQNPLHTRGVIKIQDGCANHCTYCIIPQVRGKPISRDFSEIINQAKKLIANGFKEIVLTGINISKYNFAEKNFYDLVKNLLLLDGDFRIHIPSMEPENISDEFISLFSHSKICQHIHLCLQSGSNKILKLMNRKYSAETFCRIVEKIRFNFPNFNITTDIIVGFPGETDEDFEDTLNIAEKMKFGHIHTFKYSPRENTPAAKLPQQISEKIKSERSEKLRKIADELQKEYRGKLLKIEQKILIEDVKNKIGSGYSEFYVPFCIEKCSEILKNNFVKLAPTSLENNILVTKI